jgi:ABC-2 type transport system ATP-binding protein
VSAEEYIVVVDGLVKRYGERYALRGLSFKVRRGEVYGLLGPNGAGKTTTIRAIAGALRPTRGLVRVGGFDPVREPLKVKAIVGVVPELPSLFPELTVRDNLGFIAKIYRLGGPEARRRIREVEDLLNLGSVEAVRYGALSKGWKRRVDIAAALIHDPDLLLLDEPTSGLDVIAAARLRETIARLARLGKTIILSSHYIEEVMELSDRALILYRGSKIFEGTPDTLRRVLSKKRVSIKVGGSHPGLRNIVEDILRGYPYENLVVSDSKVEFSTTRVAEAVEALLAGLRRLGVSVVDLDIIPPSWDEVLKAQIEAAERSRVCTCEGSKP